MTVGKVTRAQCRIGVHTDGVLGPDLDMAVKASPTVLRPPCTVYRPRTPRQNTPCH